MTDVFAQAEKEWRWRIFDALSFPSVIVTPAKTIVGANKKFYESYGLAPEEIIGRACFNTFFYKATPCNSQACPISKVVEDRISYSYPLKHHYKWEERVFSPILGEDGEVEYVLASIRDITRTKALENQLMGVKEFISRIIHASASAIVAADRKGRIELMNSVAQELFAGGFGEGEPFVYTEDLYPAGKAREIMKMLRDEKIGGKGKLIIPKTTVLNALGEELQVEMSAAIVYDELGNESATMAIYNDLKSKSRMEKELRLARTRLAQSEKMASLGQLAAGVAHEINNPLTGVLFYAGLLQERPDLDAAAKQDLAYIVEDTNRCKEIVKSLLVYSRSTDSNKQIVQFNEVVENSLKLIRDQKKFRNIEIQRHLSPEMMLINADTAKLNQVVINMVINAADAMEGNGAISLYTYREKVRKRVFLEIKDTGPGIPRSDLPRIFDPFFTTKAPGRSTGLGLSIVYGIIEEHDGEIAVKTTGKKGTTFVIELPLYQPQEEGPMFCSSQTL